MISGVFCRQFPCWSVFTLLILGASGCGTRQFRVAENISLTETQGICPSCVFVPPSQKEGVPQGVRVWGSFSPVAQKPAKAISGVFTAPPDLRLYLSGTPTIDGVTVALEKVLDHSRLVLKPRASPFNKWLPSDFSLPHSWSRAPVRLVIEDDNLGPFAWIGFSEPLQVETPPEFGDALRILLRTAEHFTLILLPGFAACLIAVRRGVHSYIVAGFTGLAGTGIYGYVLFWVWLSSRNAGHFVSVLLPIAVSFFVIKTYRTTVPSERAVLKPLLYPTLLTGVTALLVLLTTFVYGGLQEPFDTAASRFSHELPIDNRLPFYFSEDLAAGHVEKPLFGGWLSSDRPPLETAIVISEQPYNFKPRGEGFTVISALLQSSWVFAFWLLLSALGIDKYAITVAIVVSIFSGFAFLNTIFVWPKLLAAACMLGLISMVFCDDVRSTYARDPFAQVISGCLLALGLLSHGGSLFAAIGVIAAMLLLRKHLPRRSALILAATFVFLYLPWTFYQRFYDPPGDRLLKWHLAGITQLDKRPFFKLLRDQYGQMSPVQLLKAKEANFGRLVQGEKEFWSNTGNLLLELCKRDGQKDSQAAQIAKTMRYSSFKFFGPNFAFLLLGFPALAAGILKQHRSREWRSSCTFSVFTGVTTAVWCLLMFSSESITIHQGTYVVVLLGYAACLFAAWNVSRWLALCLGALQIGLNFMLYGILMRRPASDHVLPEGLVNYGTLSFMVLALAAAAVCLYRITRAASDTVSEPGQLLASK